MPDLRGAVTDTHPLLYHAGATVKRLGRRANAHFEACERQQTVVYVPVAVVWECSLLARAGRIDLGTSVRRFFDDLFTNPGYQPLHLDTEQLFLADEAKPNQDPFDALICAAARKLDLPLITRDETIVGSRLVRILW